MGIFSNAQEQLTLQSVVESGRISNMVVLLTCKNEEDPIKNEGDGVLTRLYVLFFSDAHGQLTP